MKGMFRKISTIFLVGVLTIQVASYAVNVEVTDVDESTSVDVIENEKKTEVSSNAELVVLNESEVYYDVVNARDGIADIRIKITNLSPYAVDGWYLIYDSDSTISSADQAEIILNKGVHYLKATDENRVIPVDGTVEFSMEISYTGEFVTPTDFRVYCPLPEGASLDSGDYSECVDTVGYSAKTEEYSLNEYDEDISDYMGDSESPVNIGVAGNTMINDGDDGDESIIGTDNRVKVSDVSVNPCKKIVALTSYFSDGTVGYATGFMISDRYMVTAAHVVYDSEHGGETTKVRAYFQRNGSNYAELHSSTKFNYPASYVSNPKKTNDWCVMKMKSGVGTTSGYFNVKYLSDAALKDKTINVTGFPGDKMVQYASASDGYKRYMYTASSSVYKVYDTYFTYKASTVAGESGGPVFNGSNTVYGIHTYGGRVSNKCRRITKGLYNSWVNNGWISG